MPRAKGNDLCEIFGFAPDDRTEKARKQWKSQQCPFVGGICIKHSHPQADGRVVVYGSCSVVNQTQKAKEEVILCPQRLYGGNYATLRTCMRNALGYGTEVYMADQYSSYKRQGKLPPDFVVLLGHNSGREVSVSNPGVIDLSFDWVMAHMHEGKLDLAVPCEVQSIDTTGNYHANWTAYAEERQTIPNSKHGMNWANVWKRLIPQLIFKSAVASTSSLCTKGLYFVVPDRVYKQFEKVLGKVAEVPSPKQGVLSVFSYALGCEVPQGIIRELKIVRQTRMTASSFASALASGKQLPLGTQLDAKLLRILDEL